MQVILHLVCNIVSTTSYRVQQAHLIITRLSQNTNFEKHTVWRFVRQNKKITFIKNAFRIFCDAEKYLTISTHIWSKCVMFMCSCYKQSGWIWNRFRMWKLMRVLKTSISNYMYIYVVVICLGVRVIDLGDCLLQIPASVDGRAWGIVKPPELSVFCWKVSENN